MNVNTFSATWRLEIAKKIGDLETLTAARVVDGLNNKIINGDGVHNYLGVTSATDDTYAHECHIALTQTAAVGVSTLTAPTDGIGSMMRFTQTNASAQRFGVEQVFEARETYKMRGQPITIEGTLRYSNNATIRYAILEWTGTADTVTTDVVNDWTSGTYTAGNFFNSTTLTVTSVGSITPSASTFTEFKLTATLGSSANNVIVFMWTEGTAAQNSTLDLEWYCTPRDTSNETLLPARRPETLEDLMCKRFLELCGSGSGDWASASVAQMNIKFDAPKRTASASVSLTTSTPQITETGVATRTGTGSTVSVVGSSLTESGFLASIDGFSGATRGNGAGLIGDVVIADARL
jgi:hypothetical protein